MATYLQGVQDYIPQIQPFQPDLNLYANLLQTKQTQYDNNWKALNKMYSTYYNAALTRDDTTAKRDNFIKQAEFNLQRISQLDLSLEQNVTQATQIFKPFYEDKLLMKDMALTKNANYQKSIANSLKGSYQKEDREMYWDTGVRAIDYKMQEFKTAAADEAMSFGNVEYTRYVNATKEARKLAKEAGLSIETVDFSPGEEWIVKTKNGEQLIEPLSKLFESELGSDPALQEVFKTEAYVNRKDYAYSNAAQFKGGEAEAEMKYLETQYTQFKEQNQRRYQSLKESSTAYDAKIADLKKQVENKTATPKTLEQIKTLEMNKSINDKILQRVESENDELDDADGEAGAFKNPYGDIKSLRFKVDNAIATSLMQKTFNEAAEIFAFKDAKQDIKANPYKVKEIDHQYRMAEIASRNAGLERAARLRNKGEMDKVIAKAKLDAGTHELDAEGNIVPVESLFQVYETNTKGGTTDEQNRKVQSKNASKMFTNDLAKPYLDNMLNVLKNLKTQGKITDAELKKILKYDDKTNVSFEQFAERIKNNPDEYLRSKVGVKGLKKIKNNFDQYVLNNGELSNFSAVSTQAKSLVETGTKLNDYYLFVEQDQKFRKESAKIVEQKLTKDLPDDLKKYAKYLYKDNGERRTENEFINVILEKEKVDLSTKTSNVKNKNVKPTKDETPGWMQVLFGSGAQPGAGNLGVSPKTVDNTVNIYKDLVQKAGQIYSNSNIELPPVPATPGSGSALSTLGNAKTINVNLKGDTPNKWRWREIANDLTKFNFGDPSKYNVTLLGPTEAAYSQIKGGQNRNDVGKAVLDAFRRESSNPKSKLGNFEVQVLPVTAGKSNQGAITIRPSLEWINANTTVYSGTGDDRKVTKQGIFEPEQAKYAAQNGVSYMMPASEINNSIMKSYYYDPIAMYLNADKDNVYKTYYPTDPRYSLSITKNDMGQEGTYNMQFKFPYLINGQEKIGERTSTGVLGNNLVTTRDQIMTDVVSQIQQNIITDFNYGGE
jgi:hypothetical protein